MKYSSPIEIKIKKQAEPILVSSAADSSGAGILLGWVGGQGEGAAFRLAKA